jgi:hypothetical protein
MLVRQLTKARGEAMRLDATMAVGDCVNLLTPRGTSCVVRCTEALRMSRWQSPPEHIAARPANIAERVLMIAAYRFIAADDCRAAYISSSFDHPMT